MASLQWTVRNMQNLKPGTGAETAQTNEARSGGLPRTKPKKKKAEGWSGMGAHLVCDGAPHKVH